MLRAALRQKELSILSRSKALFVPGARSMADGEEHASAGDLEKRLKDKLEATHLEVMDTSGGCGASFNVSVVSPQFEGKNLLARHRMVNIALQKEMQTIHALSIRKVQSQKEYETANTFK